ncbi:NYN domain-containing protein [bacterium]|nr:NYN domain-containing protein [bacterium]
MKPQILVDGYNLIHHMPDLKRQMSQDLRMAREKLIDRIAASRHGCKADITVVFDGSGAAGQGSSGRSGIRIVFSRPPEKADPVLKRMMEKKARGSQMTIVTSDGEIARFARLCGVKAVASSVWAKELKNKRLEDSGNQDVTVSRKEMEEWLLLFRNRAPADGLGD